MLIKCNQKYKKKFEDFFYGWIPLLQHQPGYLTKLLVLAGITALIVYLYINLYICTAISNVERIK